MTDPKFNVTKNQRFWRGLLFVATGVFLLLRLAAGNNNLFFLAAAWFTAAVALVALFFFLWNTFTHS